MSLGKVGRGRSTIRGEIQTFPLADLIQWLGATRRTGKLAATQNESRAEIFFEGGEIAAAVSSDLIGANTPENARAVLTLALRMNHGEFSFESGALPAQIAAGNLHLSVEPLLLDVARQFDEERKQGAATNETHGKQTFSETFTLADELRLEIVDRLLREGFRVPPMPQLAARVLELTRNNSDFSPRALGDLIMTMRSSPRMFCATRTRL